MSYVTFTSMKKYEIDINRNHIVAYRKSFTNSNGNGKQTDIITVKETFIVLEDYETVKEMIAKVSNTENDKTILNG